MSLGQTVCVAIGLWMQHEFLRSALRDASRERAWTTIQQTARELRDQFAASAPDATQPGPNQRERLQTALNGSLPAGYEVTIVDRGWQPPPCGAVAPGERFVTRSLSSSIPEPAAPQPRADEPELVCGTLVQPDGPHLAALCALPGTEYRLLLQRPLADVDAEAAPLLRPLLPIGGVTLLWIAVLLGISLHLLTARHHEQHVSQCAQSTSHVLQQTQELIRTRDAVIFALAKLAGSRDHETGGHLERLSAYSTMLAKALADHPKFAHQITPLFIRLIGLTSVPHDIGKVGIDDSILRKPGPLTPAEREQMERHTVIAGHCLQEIRQHLGNSDFLEMAREIAVAHHERWDGTGYPLGLRGEEIPLSARIVAVADVYDALTTPRVYKAALSHERSLALIGDGAGKQFDPDIVAVCLKIGAQFGEIPRRPASTPQVESNFFPARDDARAPGPAEPRAPHSDGKVAPPAASQPERTPCTATSEP
jgi:hypothetical protein